MAAIDHLKDAFAGESQANRRYLAFAKKAESEGYKQIARLFRAAAEAETVHAHAHLRALGGIKSTAENLAAAIAGEAHEFQKMYPEFLAAAKAENHRAAMMSFENALAVEETHHGLYQQALASLKAGKDLAAAAIWVCSICGHTHVGNQPDKCPVCGAVKEKFAEVK
jgi:rubrerythrin